MSNLNLNWVEIDYSIIDECIRVAAGRPFKDFAEWGYRHPDGRFFIVSVIQPTSNCWLDNMVEVSEETFNEWFTQEDFDNA